MQSHFDNGSYLAVPMAPWETNKRPLDSQDAPDTVSSSPKRSCTPENTFSSGFPAVTDSHDGTLSEDRAAETPLPLLGVNAENEPPCRAFPGADTTLPNFIHQPGTWDQVHDTVWETLSKTDYLLEVAYSPSRLFETTKTFMDNEGLDQGTPFPHMDNITSNQGSDTPEKNAGDLTSTEPNMDIASYLGLMDTELEHTKTEHQCKMDCSPTASRLGNITTQEALNSFCDSPDATGIMEHDTQLSLEASTPPKSLCSLEGPVVFTPDNDEDPSLTNFNTCLGLVRRITRTHCPLIGN